MNSNMSFTNNISKENEDNINVSEVPNSLIRKKFGMSLGITAIFISIAANSLAVSASASLSILSTTTNGRLKFPRDLIEIKSLDPPKSSITFSIKAALSASFARRGNRQIEKTLQRVLPGINLSLSNPGRRIYLSCTSGRLR